MHTLRSLSLLSFAAALGLATAPLRADTLKGKIVNSSNVGISGVRVDLGSGSLRTNTANDGTFTMTVPAGTYVVDLLPGNTAYAPRELTGVQVSGITDLGTLRLEVGFALSATVVNNANQGILGANINVYDQATGTGLFLTNDGTNALGQFTVIVPAGLYRVRATPPTLASLVTREVRDVTVSGATNLGTVVLDPGVILSGTVVDAQTSAPIANCDIDVDEAIYGGRIVTPNDLTNAAGQFSVIVPLGLHHVSFDPPSTSSNLGRQLFNRNFIGATNLGVVSLARGFAITGTVVNGINQGIANVDLDVETSPGRVKLYTSNDNSAATGAFRIIVPAGTFVFTFEPAASLLMTGYKTAPTTVTADLNLGNVYLAPGVTFSGTILAWNGVPEYGCNIDIVDPVTGDSFVTPGDITALDGTFHSVVPPGTWTVRLLPRKASFSRFEAVTNVPIGGPTVWNRQLTQAPIVCYFGTSGIPTAPSAGTVPGSVVFLNPTAATVNTSVKVSIEAPDATIIPLFGPLVFGMPAGAFGVSVDVPWPVPPANPVFLGLTYRYRLTFDDPVTGLEQDHDEFYFLIQ